MRKRVSVFVLLIGGFLFYNNYSLHLGIRQGIAGGVGTLAQKVRIFFDKAPPTTPQDLSGGTAPTIQRVANYLSPVHLTTHVMAPFDSTGGNLLVVFAGTHEDALLTPSDNFDNAWISLSGPTNFGPTSSSDGVNLRAQIWYAKNPNTGHNHIFTMTLSKGEALVLSMFVVKGSNNSDPIDVVSAIGNDAETRSLTPSSPKITTTHPYDLLIGFGKSRFSQVWTAGSGFMFQPAASSDFLVAESGLAVTPGSYNATFAIGGPTNWQAAIVAVRPAASLANRGPITLAWRASSDDVGIFGHEVERCSGANCNNFVRIGTSKDNSFVDWKLAAATVYRYRVRAIDAAGNASGYSDAITVKVGLGTN